jgi:putative ATP-dependent endonuclease of OLD family
MGPLLLQWGVGCIEQALIPQFPLHSLRSLIEDPSGEWTGMRRRTLCERLSRLDATLDELIDSEAENLIPVIVAAATGEVPDRLEEADRDNAKHFKAHGRVWFKSIRGGEELADKLLDLEPGTNMPVELRGLLEAIQQSLRIAPRE